jgi:hypothetical protein
MASTPTWVGCQMILPEHESFVPTGILRRSQWMVSPRLAALGAWLNQLPEGRQALPSYQRRETYYADRYRSPG